MVIAQGLSLDRTPSELEKRKGYIQKPLKLEDETEDIVIDTITKSHYIDKSSKHLIIL